MFATEMLLALPFDAAALFSPASRDLFSLGLRRRNHDAVRLDECEFAERECADGVWRFAGSAQVPGLAVTLRPRVETGALRMCFAVSGVPDDCALEWIEPLRLRVANPHGRLFLAHHEGEVVDDPLRFYMPQEPGWHNYVFYPGYDQMQFIGYFADGRGVCWIARDPDCGLKYFNARKGDTSVELFCRV